MNSNKPSESTVLPRRWHQHAAVRTMLSAVVLIVLGLTFIRVPESPAASQPVGEKFLHLWLPGASLLIGALLLFTGTAQVGIAIIAYRWKSNLHD